MSQDILEELHKAIQAIPGRAGSDVNPLVENVAVPLWVVMCAITEISQLRMTNEILRRVGPESSYYEAVTK